MAGSRPERAGADESLESRLAPELLRIFSAACDTLPAPSVMIALPGPAAPTTAPMPCSTVPM